VVAEDQRREGLLLTIARPFLLVFWALVLWGTLYCGVLLRAAFVDGPRAALAHALSGRDLGAGLLNLALAALAIVVWSLAGVAAWGRRATPGPDRGEGTDR
jgi:hypothetical protein